MSVSQKSFRPLRGNSGVALVIFALLLPLILGFVSLVVDYGISVTSVQKARADARMLALGAIEQYYRASAQNEDGTTPPVEQALNTTLTAVRNLQNLNRTLGSAHFSAHDVELSDTEQDPTQAANLAGRPFLIPGRYFSSTVPRAQCDSVDSGGAVVSAQVHTCDLSSCADKTYPAVGGGAPTVVNECSPCGANRSPPCFIPRSQDHASGSSETAQPSAFKIEGFLYSGFAVQFGRALLGDAVFPIKVSAVAGIIPRHFMAVVDVSGSIVQQSHPFRQIFDQQAQPLSGRSSTYAFLNATNPLDTVNQLSYPTTLATLSGTNTVYNDFFDYPAFRAGNYNQWRFLRNWQHLFPLTEPADRPWRGQWSHAGSSRAALEVLNPSDQHATDLLNSSVVHFYDDYKLKVTAGVPADDASIVANAHPDPGSCPATAPSPYCQSSQEYLVDTHTDPEPLTQILSGIRTAVDTFNERHVAGDKMGLVFFERKTPWSRIVKPTDNFNYLHRILDNSAASKELRYKLRIFPTEEEFTDLNQALAESMTQLAAQRAASGGVQSHDDLLLVTDGLTNCADCQTTNGYLISQFDFNSDGRLTVDDIFLALDCFFSGNSQPQCVGKFPMRTVDSIFTFLNVWFGGGGCSTDAFFGCADTYEYYKNSISRVLNTVQSNSSSGIPINVLAIGNMIRPSVIDRIDPSHPTQCLTDSEARNFTPPIEITDPGCDTSLPALDPNSCANSYDNKNTQPFVKANADLYRIAAISGGEFAPLFESKEAFCDPDPNNSGPSGPCVNNRSTSSPECCSDNALHTKDKLCRTMTQQVKDFVDAIMKKKTPFAIVESN